MIKSLYKIVHIEESGSDLIEYQTNNYMDLK